MVSQVVDDSIPDAIGLIIGVMENTDFSTDNFIAIFEGFGRKIVFTVKSRDCFVSRVYTWGSSRINNVPIRGATLAEIPDINNLNISQQIWNFSL